MLLFNISFKYDDEDLLRPIADGCTSEQAIDILSRHMNLAQIEFLQIDPIEYFVPFKEYTL